MREITESEKQMDKLIEKVAKVIFDVVSMAPGGLIDHKELAKDVIKASGAEYLPELVKALKIYEGYPSIDYTARQVLSKLPPELKGQDDE